MMELCLRVRVSNSPTIMKELKNHTKIPTALTDQEIKPGKTFSKSKKTKLLIVAAKLFRASKITKATKFTFRIAHFPLN